MDPSSVWTRPGHLNRYHLCQHVPVRLDVPGRERPRHLRTPAEPAEASRVTHTQEGWAAQGRRREPRPLATALKTPLCPMAFPRCPQPACSSLGVREARLGLGLGLSPGAEPCSFSCPAPSVEVRQRQ